MTDRADRALGALLGLAIGDALGMPTQGFSRSVIARRWGLLDDFQPAPADNPISAGLPAGRVTDDTDQAVILGRLLVAGGGQVDQRRLAEELLAWEKVMRANGSHDLLGPSTALALQRLAAGVPISETGRTGTTNGAAMRIAPVGIAVGPGDPDALADAVHRAGRVTHDTGTAVAGAAAVAMAISSGIAGATMTDSLDRAITAAERGEGRGEQLPGPSVAARLRWALTLVDAADPLGTLDRIDRLVGTGLATAESVPAALAVAALFPGDPWLAGRSAAGLGGDCDTVAAMAGAVVAAHTGASALPVHAVAALGAANPDLDLAGLAAALLALRPRDEPSLDPARAQPEGVAGRVVSAASILVDLAVDVPAVPERGGDVLASPVRVSVAGGFNLLVAAGRQGVATVYAGTFGSGPYGELVAAALSAAGIGTSNGADPSGDTGVCLAMIEPDAERTFVTSPGVEARITAAVLGRTALRRGDVVAVSGYDLVYPGSGRPTVDWLQTVPVDIPVLLDPGPLVAEIPPAIWTSALARVTILSLNEREAGLLIGPDGPAGTDLHDAVRRVTSLADDVLLVIRRGAAGCTVDGGPDRVPVALLPSIAVTAVDSTGAGDTHAGALLAGLVHGRPLAEALRRANIAAALSVTRSGPTAAPTAAELQAAVDGGRPGSAGSLA